jgi:predicted PurR-regulated permease PerM
MYVLVVAWAALLPFFLGLLLAYLLMPVVDFIDRHAPRALQRRRLSRPLAIVIVYIVLIGVVAGALSYFIPAITKQAEAFGEVAPTYWERIQGLLVYDIDPFLEQIPPQIRTAIEANIEQASSTLANALQTGLTVTIRTVSQTVSFVIGMFIVPFWLFYVLNDRDKAKRAIYRLIPEVAREDVRNVGIIVDDLLSAYLRGQLVLMLVVGTMATVVLLIFGIDLALLVGTVAGITELIPVLGPFIGAVPAVLLALLKRPILAVWVALAFFMIQQIENALLVPRISGHAVRFHAAVVMIIVVMGAEVAGLWGLLLAVPVAAVVRDVFQYLYLRTTERGATPKMAYEYLRARNM